MYLYLYIFSVKENNSPTGVGDDEKHHMQKWFNLHSTNNTIICFPPKLLIMEMSHWAKIGSPLATLSWPL